MINCPFCSADNIEGADTCDECGQSLADAHITAPASEIERSLLKDGISALQPKSPITVALDAPVREVLKLMVQKRIGCAFVVEDERLVGIFTERDALMRIGVAAVEFGDRPVSQFMTGGPRVLMMDAKVAFAVRMMDQGGYRHIPVVDQDNKPVGAISARDILGYFADKLAAAAV